LIEAECQPWLRGHVYHMACDTNLSEEFPHPQSNFIAIEIHALKRKLKNKCMVSLMEFKNYY
jgi:hypothetical protein